MKDNKKTSIFFFSLWTLLILFLFLEPYFFEDLIPATTALRESSFSRVMFMDIGVLATLSAVWIIQSSGKSYRYLFALAVIFVGSFALLPYLGIYYWLKD